MSVTVKRLIEILSKMPQDHIVEVHDDDGGLEHLEESDIINMDVFGKGHEQVVIG
jgi:hypothetical protein